jgi:ABC-type multidrug transport system fused ATPase/permease subunit
MPILKRLLPYYKYLKPVWFKFLVGILFGVLFSGLGLPVMAETIFPILFGNASEAPEWLRLFVERWFGDNIENGFLILCCLALPGVMFLRMVGSVGNGHYMTYSGISVVQAIQIDMFKKVQALRLAFVQNYKTGELNAGVMGYATILSERGNSLSGGQRQRIAIARAFLKDAPILVLDEATSALDNQSDRFIQEALTRLAKDRTTLIIAHRLNSLESVERRLYFEKGRIAGDGSHQALLTRSSGYRKLVNADTDEAE